MNYYKATPEKPYHLSIGAIIFNEDYSKILCHYIKEVGHVKDIYVLMRESMEPNEKFEKTLERGAREEFGATVEIINFLGSVGAVDKWFGEIDKETDVQKTTLYFLCQLIDQEDSKRVDDGTVEGKSELVWLTPEELRLKMKLQFEKYGVSNIDEREIIERAEKYVGLNKINI